MHASGKIAVFMDRDGVINEEVDLLHRLGQLKLINGAADGIARLNSLGIPAIVATNQSVVARGLCTQNTLRAIHTALKERLEARGAHLDDIYYCPHHPNANLAAYRKTCPSRKPGIGMLIKARHKFGIDLASSFFIGDRTIDIQTGKNAHCTTIIVATGYGGSDSEFDVKPDHKVRDLKEASLLIESLLKSRKRQ